jgi:hypothetical protein
MCSRFHPCQSTSFGTHRERPQAARGIKRLQLARTHPFDTVQNSCRPDRRSGQFVERPTDVINRSIRVSVENFGTLRNQSANIDFP